MNKKMMTGWFWTSVLLLGAGCAVLEKRAMDGGGAVSERNSQGSVSLESPFAYLITNGTITITQYMKPSGVVKMRDGLEPLLRDLAKGSVDIPSTINGLSVTSIGDNAFRDCANLTDVTIPNSVTRIGRFAFKGCTGLTHVTLPGKLTTIGYWEFYGCSSLTNVELPASVVNICPAAFGHCSKLQTVYFNGNAPTMGSDVFRGADKATIYFLPGTTGWGKEFGGRPTAVWNNPAMTQVGSPAAVPSLVAPSWTNSLGMVFVPVPGTAVQFSIWDTRVQDYQAFATATGRAWEKPAFEQGPTHPAVMVSWNDAKAFCVWLTEKDRHAGTLNAVQEYRLPTDLEWSTAVGLPKETGSTPRERNEKIADVFPWGTQWPPPRGVGNYCTRSDDFDHTSPVGSFAANRFGLCDMGGNVWQWCEDLIDGQSGTRVLRGSAWHGSVRRLLLSSCRCNHDPDIRLDRLGFRCVLTSAGASAGQVPSGVADSVAVQPEPKVQVPFACLIDNGTVAITKYPGPGGS